MMKVGGVQTYLERLDEKKIMYHVPRCQSNNIHKEGWSLQIISKVLLQAV
jgi:hypothetical protein